MELLHCSSSTLSFMQRRLDCLQRLGTRGQAAKICVFASRGLPSLTHLGKNWVSLLADRDHCSFGSVSPVSATDGSLLKRIHASSDSEVNSSVLTTADASQLGTDVRESLEASTSSESLQDELGPFLSDKSFLSIKMGRKGFRNRFLIFTRLGTTIQKALESFFHSEIRQRTFVTILMLIVVRAGHFIPLPGFDRRFMSGDYLAYVSGTLDEVDPGYELRMSLFQLGIGPYIGASIIMQVLCYIVPHLVRLRKEGSEGVKQIKKYTEQLAFALAVIQSFILAFQSLAYSVYATKNKFGHMAVTTTLLSAGAVLINWICNKISDSGFGQGASLFICVSILTGYANSLYKVISSFIYGGGNWGPTVVALFGVSLCFTICAVLASTGHRKVKLQYYNFGDDPSACVVGSFAEVEPYIPFNIIPMGMQPLLGVSIMLGLPAFLARITNNEFWVALKEALNPSNNSWLYHSVTVILIFLFNILDLGNIPVEVNKYLMKIGARIPKIKPGNQTVEYLTKIQMSTRFWGGLMLSLLAMASSLVDRQFQHIYQGHTIGFSSMLIIVGAILDLRRTFLAYNVMPSLSAVLNRFDAQ
eukprot:c21515_g1_i2 orf=527-2287(-)